MKLNGYAHWVLKRGDWCIVVHAGSVKGEEEISEAVVNEFVEIVEELMDCGWNFSRVIPPENMDDGALVDGVVRVDYLWGGEVKEGIDRDKEDADRVIMNRASPLKIMICGDGEGGPNVSFPKRGKGSIVGLMD